MSANEGSGQSPRYCTSCGAQIRLDNTFCTSCGASLSPESAGPDLARSVSQPHVRPVVDYQNIAQGKAERLLRWFREQPLITKAAIVGLVLIVLVMVLGPINHIVSAIVVGISFFALLVRVAQHKSTRGWGITLATSLILTLLLSGISGILDSGSSTEDVVSNRGDPTARESVGGEDDYEVPVDVYLIEQDPFFMEGYLAVNLDDDVFIASNWLGNTYISGDVFPDGGLYWNGNQIGDLDNYEYACTYEGDDPRGFEEAMQEACGFAPSVED